MCRYLTPGDHDLKLTNLNHFNRGHMLRVDHNTDFIYLHLFAKAYQYIVCMCCLCIHPDNYYSILSVGHMSYSGNCLDSCAGNTLHSTNHHIGYIPQ